MGLTSIALARQMYCNMQSSGGEIAVKSASSLEFSQLGALKWKFELGRRVTVAIENARGRADDLVYVH